MSMFISLTMIFLGVSVTSPFPRPFTYGETCPSFPRAPSQSMRWNDLASFSYCLSLLLYGCVFSWKKEMQEMISTFLWWFLPRVGESAGKIPCNSSLWPSFAIGVARRASISTALGRAARDWIASMTGIMPEISSAKALGESEDIVHSASTWATADRAFLLCNASSADVK